MKLKEVRVHRKGTVRMKRAPQAPAERDIAPHAEQWTGGPALRSRLVSIGLIAALCTGPVSLAVAALRPTVTQAAETAQEIDLTASSAAAARATELVEAWLGASRDDDTLLKTLYSGPLPALPASGVATRSSDVTQLVDEGDGLWSVTVAIDVEEVAAPAAAEGAEEAPVSSWQRRYFQVPVQVSEAPTGPALQALMLPAPVAPPETLTTAALDYPASLPLDGTLASTVTNFLAALTAGQGEVARYVSPGVVLTPITPAPYVAATVQSLAGRDDAAATETPTEGQSADVLVTATFERLDGELLVAQYQLSLVARAGRWEVADLPTAPATRIPIP